MSDFSFWRGSPADCQVASCQLPVATRWLDRDWLVGRLVGWCAGCALLLNFFFFTGCPRCPGLQGCPGRPGSSWVLEGNSFGSCQGCQVPAGRPTLHSAMVHRYGVLTETIWAGG